MNLQPTSCATQLAFMAVTFQCRTPRRLPIRVVRSRCAATPEVRLLAFADVRQVTTGASGAAILPLGGLGNSELAAAGEATTLHHASAIPSIEPVASWRTELVMLLAGACIERCSAVLANKVATIARLRSWLAFLPCAKRGGIRQSPAFRRAIQARSSVVNCAAALADAVFYRWCHAAIVPKPCINSEYAEMSRRRIHGDAPLLNSVRIEAA